MTQIRFASPADADKIVAFIDEHWKQGHIFTRRRDLFEWQHGGGGKESLSFVLGIDETTGGILGVLGFVPVRHYDDDAPGDDLTLAIWKVREDCDVGGLGLFLFKRLTKQLRPDFIGVIGLSEMVVPIYRALGFETGLLDHFVCFNNRLTTFRLAKGVTGKHLVPDAEPAAGYALVHLKKGKTSSGEDAARIDALARLRPPARTWTYLRSRYLECPYYDYTLSLLQEQGRPVGGFVWRKVEHGGSACLRIVDFIGESRTLGYHRADLQALLSAERAEYVDIQHVGVPHADLFAAGFVDRRADPDLVVPHYFEPFCDRNVDLDFAYKVFDKDTDTAPLLLRGFSDQDRPNLLPDGERGAGAEREAASQ